MADTTTTNLSLTKPELDVSTNWGQKLNANLDALDAIFSATGTGVSLNIDGGDIASAVTINKSPVITLGGDLTGNVTLTNLASGTLSASLVAESVQDIVGPMFSSNTENAISVGYEDSDGTIDLSVLVDDSSIEINPVNNTLNVKASGVTNAMLAGSIANSKLSNSSITVGAGATATAISLGGTLTFAGTSNEVEVTESSGTITVGLPAATEITTSLGVAGGSTNGVVISNGSIALKNDGTQQSNIDFYCESSNAHYARLQAPAHSAFSGNVTVTLPSTTGTLALTSGDITGNAATATALATARTIQGVSFDGTGDVDLTEAIQDVVGGMVSGNTESNITVTYEDSDGTLDFSVTGGGSVSEAFKTISVSGQSDVVADAAADTLTLVAGSNMTITTNASGDEITFASSGGGGSQNLFSTISVSGQSDVVADATTDTLTLVAGSNITLTTDASSDSITIASSASGSGGSSSTFAKNTFAGDGSTTAFTLSTSMTNEDGLIVFIDGVYQADNVYTVSGTTLTFATAPVNGRVIEVFQLEGGIVGTTPSIDTMTGDGSDTTLALSTTPSSENQTFVTFDGVVQHKSTYSISGSTLTFSTAPATGVAVECITFNNVAIATFEDADGDTKIQVEESSDEDTIRMDIAGTEVLTLTNSAMTLKGTTPTLTIGDGGEEDTKIIFNGNSVDYHIGLDDSQDDLIIGRDTTLGSHPAIQINADKRVGLGGAPVSQLHVMGGNGVIFDNPNNGYSGLKITDDTSGDYNINFLAGRSQGNTKFKFFRYGREQNVTPWSDYSSPVEIAHISGGSVFFAGDVGVGTTSPNNETNRISLELDDTWGGVFQNSVSGTPKSEWRWNTSGHTIFGSVANEDLAFVTNNTEALRIDTAGHVTKPLQPAVLVQKSSEQTNVTANTTVTIEFDSEVFDVNADFDTSNYTFTAPVTGKYQVNLRIRRENLPTNLTYVQTYLATSNGTIYMFLFGSGADLFNEEVIFYSENGSILLNMDANDTLQVRQYQSGGSSTSEIGEQTYLSIALLS